MGLQITHCSHQLQPRAHRPLCIIFMRLRITEIDQNAVAHVLRDEAAEALNGLCDALLVGRNDLAQVFGVHAGRQAVEPTRSENITVTWRRSARSSGRALGAVTALTLREEVFTLASLRRAAIASSNLRRCPSAATPSSFRSSAVRFGRTFSFISFSRNAASYFPRPRLRSQTTMSMLAPATGGCAHHGLPRRVCPGRAGVGIIDSDADIDVLFTDTPQLDMTWLPRLIPGRTSLGRQYRQILLTRFEGGRLKLTVGWVL